MYLLHLLLPPTLAVAALVVGLIGSVWAAMRVDRRRTSRQQPPGRDINNWLADIDRARAPLRPKGDEVRLRLSHRAGDRQAPTWPATNNTDPRKEMTS